MYSPPKSYNGAGILFVIATLLGWSTVLLFLKYLVPLIDGWTANGWRYGVSALMWSPLLIAGVARKSLPSRIWTRALPPSVVNCAGQVCFAWSIYYIDAGLAAFLLRVSLVFSTLGAFVLFADERVLIRSRLFWIGMSLVLIGSAVTILTGEKTIEGGTAVGILLGVAAGACFGLYGVSVRHWMSGVPAMTSFAAISLYTSLGMISLMLLLGEQGGAVVFGFSVFNWMILIVSALIGIALGHVFFYAAIARLGVAVTNAIVQLAPFLCGAASVWLYGEVLTFYQWFGGGLLLAGGIVLLKAERLRPRTRAIEPRTDLAYGRTDVTIGRCNGSP